MYPNEPTCKWYLSSPDKTLKTRKVTDLIKNEIQNISHNMKTNKYNSKLLLLISSINTILNNTHGNANLQLSISLSSDVITKIMHTCDDDNMIRLN